MYKKYKVKRKRHINLFVVIIILIIATFIMSYGYAYFSDKLTITGKANILFRNTEYTGKSVYNHTIVNSWGMGTASDPKIYQMKLDITNYDGDLSEWTVEFDVQDGIVPNKIYSWATSSVDVSGNTIIMVCQPWNANVANGGTVNLEFQLAFSNTKPLNVSNVKFNGEAIKLSLIQ